MPDSMTAGSGEKRDNRKGPKENQENGGNGGDDVFDESNLENAAAAIELAGAVIC